MNILSAVKRKHNIAHFLVAKVDYFIVNKHTVCCKSKAEILVKFLFLLSAVFDKLFAHIPVEKRFSAEKVNFKILSCATLFNQKVECSFADFKAHQAFVGTAVFAFARKTVFAVEVASVCNMKANGFDYTLTLFEFLCGCFKSVLRKKSAVCNKALNILKTFLNILVGYICSVGIFVKNICLDFVFCIFFVSGDNIICNLVNAVNTSAVLVKNDIVSVQFVCVYHNLFLSKTYLKHRKTVASNQLP